MFYCKHTPEVRKKTCSNGTVHYGAQCSKCGASVLTGGRTWITKAEATRDGRTPPPWVERGAVGHPSLFGDLGGDE